MTDREQLAALENDLADLALSLFHTLSEVSHLASGAPLNEDGRRQLVATVDETRSIALAVASRIDPQRVPREHR